MNRIRPHMLGSALAGILAIWHMLWSLLVAAGVAQPVIDFIFRLHMISPVYKVDPFNAGTAAALVLVTGAIGYLAGWSLAFVWNHCNFREANP